MIFRSNIFRSNIFRSKIFWSNLALVVVSSLLAIYWLTRWYEHSHTEESTLVRSNVADKTINQTAEIEVKNIVTPSVTVNPVQTKPIAKETSPTLASATRHEKPTDLPLSSKTLPSKGISKSKTVVVTLSSDPDDDKRDAPEEIETVKLDASVTDKTKPETVVSTVDSSAPITAPSPETTVETNTPTSKVDNKLTTAITKETKTKKETSTAGFVAPTVQTQDSKAVIAITSDTSGSQQLAAENINSSSSDSGKIAANTTQPKAKGILSAQQLLQKKTELQTIKNVDNENTDNKNTEPTASYRINKGDTLYALARRFNTTVDALKEINGLRSNTIHVGDKIKYPSSN